MVITSITSRLVIFGALAGTMVDSLHSVFVFGVVFNNSLMLGGVTAEGRSPEDGMEQVLCFWYDKT